jgi:hypothetical protein
MRGTERALPPTAVGTGRCGASVACGRVCTVTLCLTPAHFSGPDACKRLSFLLEIPFSPTHLGILAAGETWDNQHHTWGSVQS